MAKDYTELDKVNEEFFRKLISEKESLEMNVRFKFRGDTDAKLMLDAKKVSPLNKSISDKTDIVVVVNEDIFDRLTDEMQVLATKEMIHGITFDSEKDIVNVETKNFTSYREFIADNDINELIILSESIKSIQDQLDKQKKEDKANSKSKR